MKGKSRFNDYFRTLTFLQLLSNQCRWDVLVWVPQQQFVLVDWCPWTPACDPKQNYVPRCTLFQSKHTPFEYLNEVCGLFAFNCLCQNVHDSPTNKYTPAFIDQCIELSFCFIYNKERHVRRTQREPTQTTCPWPQGDSNPPPSCCESNVLENVDDCYQNSDKNEINNHFRTLKRSKHQHYLQQITHRSWTWIKHKFIKIVLTKRHKAEPLPTESSLYIKKGT